MNNTEIIREALKDHQPLNSSCRELLSVLGIQEGAEEIGCGRMAAREGAATFRIRSDSLKRAGIDTQDLDEVVQALGEAPPEDPILLYHFGTGTRYLTAFLNERTQKLIGCWSMNRRTKP